MLREMFERPAQTPQLGWSEHEPVAARRGTLRRKRLAEQLVVGFEIGDADARFGYAGRAAGFGNINRFASEALGNPAPYWPAAQPFVFAMAKPFQIIVAVSFFARIEIQFQAYAFAHTSILHMLWASWRRLTASRSDGNFDHYPHQDLCRIAAWKSGIVAYFTNASVCSMIARVAALLSRPSKA